MLDMYTYITDICKQLSSLSYNIKEYGGVIMIKKIFISQPFSGRTEVEVMKEKEEIIKWLKIIGIDATVLDQYHQSEPPIDDPEKKRIWFLANSIQMMSMVDLVVFSDNWESAKGCRIEHEIAIEYNLPYIELHKNENPGQNIGNFESLSIEKGEIK